MISSDPAALLGPFLDPVAIAIVLGGTVLATVLRTPAADIGRGVTALRTLVDGAFDAAPLVEQIAALGRIARRHGVMALDRSVIADPDIAAAVALIVDGCGADDVEALLDRRRRARIDRHVAAAEMWCAAAETSPAMGMVGTLVGLVGMFTRMDDPTTIGGAMAIALLATLYGALLANLIFMPVAARLRRRARTEADERLRLTAPLLALAAREEPRSVSFVPARTAAL